MAQQEDPLYDFPEPIKPQKRNLQKLQRGRGSLRSISVLDRLLLTVPVWLQLSINPATALHILQREPPGVWDLFLHSWCACVILVYSFSPSITWSLLHPVISCVLQQSFLVRKSRTSQRNVLCVRLADDSVPSFVQEFGIRKEQSSKYGMHFLYISFPSTAPLNAAIIVSQSYSQTRILIASFYPDLENRR